MGYLVAGTWYLVAGMRLVPGAFCLVPGTRYLVPVPGHLVPVTWCLVPGTWCRSAGIVLHYCTVWKVGTRRRSEKAEGSQLMGFAGYVGIRVGSVVLRERFSRGPP